MQIVCELLNYWLHYWLQTCTKELKHLKRTCGPPSHAQIVAAKAGPRLKWIKAWIDMNILCQAVSSWNDDGSWWLPMVASCWQFKPWPRRPVAPSPRPSLNSRPLCECPPWQRAMQPSLRSLLAPHSWRTWRINWQDSSLIWANYQSIIKSHNTHPRRPIINQHHARSMFHGCSNELSLFPALEHQPRCHSLCGERSSVLLGLRRSVICTEYTQSITSATWWWPRITIWYHNMYIYIYMYIQIIYKKNITYIKSTYIYIYMYRIIW